MQKPQDQWTTRIWQEHSAGTLTRCHRDVLLTLRTFQGIGGACWPSHATLAQRARCSVRTVQRALHQAQLLGLVRWAERRVKAAWRWLRTSNSYRLTLPDTPVDPALKPVWHRRDATTGQSAREGESPSKKEALREMMREAFGLPDLLSARRAAFTASQKAARLTNR